MIRLVEADRPVVEFILDGEPVTAQMGDTVLTAVLALRRHLRHSDFGDGPRAGFCLMGACQDCWVRADGVPVRACGTLVSDGVTIATSRKSGG
jgi:predicted molibdopterin-dependent oxidoreductase YjgC